MRDSQKQKCYNAEDVIRKNQPHLIRRLETVGEMQDYVCSIHHSKILRRKYGALLDLDARPIHVGDGRARSRAGASGSSRIKMPTWSRCDMIVLHEVAHCLDYRVQFWPSQHTDYVKGLRQHGTEWTGHGWRWCFIYLDLVRSMMGVEVAEALTKSFKAHKVRFTKPKPKRKVSPEQRQALVDRMAVARAARKPKEPKRLVLLEQMLNQMFKP